MESINFDRAAAYYDETRGFPLAIAPAVGAAFAKVGGFGERSRILEIGVGTGRIAVPLAAHVGQYVGVDISRQMMLRLRAKTVAVWAVQGSATALPLPSAVLDGVVAVHVFHLIPQWQQAIAELGRVLRPAGRLVHAWNHSVNTPQDELREVWEQALPPEYRGDPVGVKFEERDAFLVDAGWTLVEQDSLEYSISNLPADVLRGYRERLWSRLWSRLWRLPDDIHAQAMRALEAAVVERFPDLHSPFSYPGRFELQAYTPPPRR